MATHDVVLRYRSSKSLNGMVNKSMLVRRQDGMQNRSDIVPPVITINEESYWTLSRVWAVVPSLSRRRGIRRG